MARATARPDSRVIKALLSFCQSSDSPQYLSVAHLSRLFRQGLDQTPDRINAQPLYSLERCLFREQTRIHLDLSLLGPSLGAVATNISSSVVSTGHECSAETLPLALIEG